MTPYELSAKERLRLQEFLAAIDLFADLEPNMPLQMMRAFVFTALYEGEGSMEIGRKAGLSSGVIARHLGDWGELDRYKKPSHAMIEGRSVPTDRRARLQFLTPKGKAFLARLLRTLRA